MLNGLKNKFRLYFLRRRWRKLNNSNKTTISHLFPINLAKIGNSSYGDINILTWNHVNQLKIGSFCSIAPEVTFILDAEHHLNIISTYPFKAQTLIIGPEAFSKGNIIVDDDVWIGFRSTIMSGVHIGQGAVVAAGAVVTKDVPPYAIIGGVPAKIIKYRFSPEVIEQLLKLDYSKLSDDMIRERIDDLYTSLDGKSPEEVEKLLAWFPKK